MENKLGGFITVFIVVMVGLVLAEALGNAIVKVEDLGTVTNKSIDISSLRGEDDGVGNFTTDVELSLGRDDLASFSEMRMENGTAFTENTDYYVNLTEGTFRLLDTETTASFDSDNNTLADYTYYPDAYVKDSMSRVIIKTLIMVFFVMGILMFVYAWVKKEFDL